MAQWNSQQWNSGQWNGGSSGSFPLAQFTTVQPGDTLNVFGFYSSDTLYYGFLASDGVVGTLQTATFKIRTDLTSDTDLISLAIGLGSSSDGAITAVGDNNYGMYFIISASSLTPGDTYVYILTATDVNARTGSWTGFFRTMM